MAFAMERHGDGPEHYASVSDGFVFEIYPADGEGQRKTKERMGFSVGDVDAVFAALVARGGVPVVRPRGKGGWGRHAVAADMDGRRVEIGDA